MDRYCYKVKITCTFKRTVYGDIDAEALKDANSFQIKHSNGYQVATDKKVEIIDKFLK